MLPLKHGAARLAGGILYPFMMGYMNAKYRKKLHVSRFRNDITLVYARVDAIPVVISVDEVTNTDRETLGSWFHSTVAKLNSGEVIPQLDKFNDAAKRAQELAHSEFVMTPCLVPRVIRPSEAV